MCSSSVWHQFGSNESTDCFFFRMVLSGWSVDPPVVWTPTGYVSERNCNTCTRFLQLCGVKLFFELSAMISDLSIYPGIPKGAVVPKRGIDGDLRTTIATRDNFASSRNSQYLFASLDQPETIVSGEIIILMHMSILQTTTGKHGAGLNSRVDKTFTAHRKRPTDVIKSEQRLHDPLVN